MADYDAIIAHDKATATQRANGATLVSPDTAASAIAISPNPGAAMFDIDTQRENAQARTNAAVVQGNPAMARWANGDPAHVAASQDHFSWLDTMSNGLQLITKGTVLEPIGALAGEMSAEAKGAAETVLHGAQPEKLPKDYSAATQLEAWLAQHVPGQRQLASGVRAILPRAFAAASAPIIPLTSVATQAVGEPIERATGFPKQVTGQFLTMMAPIAGLGIKAATEAPKAKPATPMAEAAENSATILDTVHRATQKSPIQTRSPATMREFVAQHTNGTHVETIGIAADKIRDLYEEAGITPMPNDGLLGWVPDLGPKLATALSAGGEVEVPLADYLTKVDEATHSALRDGIRLGDSPSIDEAKAVGETEGKGTAPRQTRDTIPDLAVAERIAANPAIAKAAKTQYLSALFENPKAAGMSTDQFNRYSKAVESQAFAAYDKIVDAASRQMKREQGEEWKAEFAKRTDAVRNEILSDPAVVARNIKETGKSGGFSVKLDDEALAESMGFDSAEQMNEAIIALNADRGKMKLDTHIEKLIKDETNRRVADVLRDFMSPEYIKEIVRSSLHSPEAIEVLNQELAALAKQAGLPFAKADIRAHAEALFGELPVREAVNIRKWERLALKGGQQAEIALLKKNKAEDAFRAKQQQLVSVHMLARAHEFAREQRRTMDSFKRWAASPTSAGIDQEYLNYIHDALAKAGFEIARDPRELRGQLTTSLEKFIEDRQADRDEVVLADVPDNLRTTSVDEFLNFRDMLVSLAKNGRDAKSLATSVGKIELKSAVNEAKDSFAEFAKMNRKFKPSDFKYDKDFGGLVKVTRHGFRGIDAALIQLETMFDFFDKFDPQGIFNRAAVIPLEDALGWKDKNLADIRKTLLDFAKSHPKGWGKSLEKVIDEPYELDGDKIFRKRKHVVALLLNWGNESNLDKAVRGFNITREQAQALIDKHMTKADWDFAQHIWDMFEKYWPVAESLYRDLAGVAPAKLEFTAHKTPFGDYRGGYWPLREDPLYFRDSKASHRSVYDPAYRKGTPTNRYAHARTSVIYPLDLDLDSFPMAIEQYIHDLAFRKPIREASKFLLHPEILKGIQENLGQEYVDQIRPWLQDAANASVFEDRATKVFRNIMDYSAAGATIVGLAYRPAVAMMHWGSAQFLSISEVGMKNYAKAYWDIYKTPWQTDKMIKWMDSVSTELPRRNINLDRDTRANYQLTFKREGTITKLRHFQYHMVAYSDMASAYPTFLAEYRTAKAKGFTDKQAAAAADKAVRRAHGSGGKINQSAIQRDKNWRYLSMFMSFVSRMYNRDRIATRYVIQGVKDMREGDYAGGRRDFEKVMSHALFGIVGVAAVHELVKGTDSEDSWLTAAAKGIGYRMVAGLPIVRDIYTSVEKGYDYAFSPIGATIKTGIHTTKGLLGSKKWEDQSMAKRWIQHTAEVAGALFHLPIGQAGQTSQFLYDFATGKEKPKDFHEIVHGLMFGRSVSGPQPHHRHRRH